MNRTTYFLVGVGSVFVFIASLLVASTLGARGGSAILLVIGLLALLWWIQTTTAAKRFHDMGQSGWLVLLFLIPIPFVGFGVSIWLLVGAGNPGENQHGPPPGPGFGL